MKIGRVGTLWVKDGQLMVRDFHFVDYDAEQFPKLPDGQTDTNSAEFKVVALSTLLAYVIEHGAPDVKQEH